MKLEHVVYFTLHDKSPEKIDGLVVACHQYLRDHPGVLRCETGTLNGDLKRPVNDHDYQVSLHVTFDSRQSHDAYQTAPRHLQFIEEQRGNWARVRVFDSDLR
jgi:hypothetical protein